MTIPSNYPVSTVPYTIAYLQTAFQTQLDTDPNVNQILLFTGNDPGPNAPLDLIAIANVSRNIEHFAMVGDGSENAMYEKYAVYVKLSAGQRAATQAEASAYLIPRVWQLLSYLEYAVRRDPSLGMAGSPDNAGLTLTAWPGQTQGGMNVVAADNNGWICELSWKVDCEATQ